jgi:hypothetical protein
MLPRLLPRSEHFKDLRFFFPFWHSSEINPANLSQFKTPQKRPSEHHVCHAIHHNCTTMYHHETRKKITNTQTKPRLLHPYFFRLKNRILKKKHLLTFISTQPIGKGRDLHAHPKVLSPRTQLDT